VIADVSSFFLKGIRPTRMYKANEAKVDFLGLLIFVGIEPEWIDAYHDAVRKDNYTT
jgi:hypothetical protein